MTLSRSKNREDGIRFSRKVCKPLRPSLGRNHVAQTATVRGSVEILEGGFFFRAADSSAGVTRYDEKERGEDILNSGRKVEREHCERKT